jgi:ABC-2 type transport system permease protein
VSAQAEEANRLSDLHQEAIRLERDGGDVSTFRDPRNPSLLGQSRGGRYAILPVASLVLLSIGQSDLLPSYYRMSTDAREVLLSASELENPYTLLTGRFDLSFVIIYLYPLLILALTYNLLSSEREQGTLTLTLAQPVALVTLLRAKMLLRAALIVGFAVVVCILGILTARVAVSGETVVRLALWTLVVITYGVFWCSAALAVAAFGRSSATNAMALAGVWLLMVVLLPSAVNLAVTSVYPVPSRVEMIQAVRTASDDATEEGSRVLARYYEDHPELAAGSVEQAMTDFNILRIAVNDEVERRVRPVVAEYDRQLAAHSGPSAGCDSCHPRCSRRTR